MLVLAVESHFKSFSVNTEAAVAVAESSELHFYASLKEIRQFVVSVSQLTSPCAAGSI